MSDYIEVDGLRVGPCMWRNAKDEITRLQAENEALRAREAGLVEALTELCDEIDKHDIHAAISKTNISWFKRKARKALAKARG